MSKIYTFDLDGTLCSQQEDYYMAKPYTSRIETVNRLFAEGHTIQIYTARGSTTGIDWEELTRKQLSRWGLNYHQLIIGKKPHSDYYIDDKSIHPSKFFNPFEEITEEISIFLFKITFFLLGSFLAFLIIKMILILFIKILR